MNWRDIVGYYIQDTDESGTLPNGDSVEGVVRLTLMRQNEARGDVETRIVYVDCGLPDEKQEVPATVYGEAEILLRYAEISDAPATD